MQPKWQWQKDYPSASNISETNLDENSSLKKMLDLVGENKRVVDFGCATGYFAQLLTSKGCQVTGVEMNSKAAQVAEQYCEQVIVADLDFVSIAELLPAKTFDVAVFGDVLEHLRNPWKVLELTRQILKPEGYVVASIPNIAHGAIRLALLKGQFEYTEVGILDDTHLRFFTRKTVEKLFEETGYFIEVVKPTKLPICSDSNLVPYIDKSNFDNQIVEQIEQDEDADTLQFVIKAFTSSLGGQYAALNEQYFQMVEEIKYSHTQLEQIKVELKQSQIELQEKKNELECSQVQMQNKQVELESFQKKIQEKQVCLERAQAQLQYTQTEMKQSQLQLQQALMELQCSQSHLQQTQAELEQSHSQTQKAQAELELSQLQLQQTEAKMKSLEETITAMRSSKFWKMRTAWLNCKKWMKVMGDN
jgi:2-polyprenyl-3-methyl-5-hydroxy-6-metoxy-1,4-benzoquinol methylase